MPTGGEERRDQVRADIAARAETSTRRLPAGRGCRVIMSACYRWRAASVTHIPVSGAGGPGAYARVEQTSTRLRCLTSSTVTSPAGNGRPQLTGAV